MAQWLGQFSGHTHESKVEDAETALSQTIESLRAAISDPEREKKAKAVKRLAERLMTLRLKMIKARISKLADTRARKRHAGMSTEIESLERKHAAIWEQGVDAIFREFRAQDLL